MAINRNGKEKALRDNSTHAEGPIDQVKASLQSVTDALKAASESASARGQEVGLCAIKQAEQNATQMFETLRGMAAAKDPVKVSQLYTQFMSESAEKHAEQLREMGELLAKSSREAWQPVTSALASATPKTN